MTVRADNVANEFLIESKESTPSLRAYLLLLFLTSINILNFTGRLLPTSLGLQIQQDIKIGHGALGLLSGTYFVLTYTFASLLFGVLADRWKRTHIIAFGVLVFGAMTLLSGFAQRFGHLIAARMLFGIGQAALTPPALSLISQTFPAEKRGMATAIYYAGLPLGGGLSLMLSSWLVPLPAIGWRGCMILVGASSMAMLFPLVLITSGAGFPACASSADGVHQRAGSKVRPTEGFWQFLRSMFRSPTILLTLLGAICVVFMGAAGNLRMVWLQKERGFPVQIGTIAGLMYLFGGVAGSAIGGWLGDRWERRGTGGRLKFAAYSQLVMTPIVLLSYLIPPTSAFFYVAWFGALLATTLYYGPVYAAIQDMVPPQHKATAVGMLIFSVNLIGVGGGPWLAGAIGDRFSLTAGLSIASCASFLAFPCFLIAARTINTQKNR